MPLFIGENLQNIRIMYGYTRKQMGDILHTTEQSIWQYENGYMSPKMDILNQATNKNINLHHIAYRSTTRNSIQKTETEAKHVEFIDAFLKRIESNIKYSTIHLDTLREYAIELLNDEHGSRLENIKQIAKTNCKENSSYPRN